MSTTKAVFTGTSGWHYRHWKGPFYPDDLPDSRMLGYYIRYFGTAEINNTFYHLPGESTFTAWRDSVPDDFVFAIKASRYITHMKKLKDPGQSLSKFMQGVELLENKAGPILFQLPPKWGLNIERLREFLEALPAGHRYAFEFRDPDWFDDRVTEALAGKNAAFCIYDFNGRQSPRRLTADFVYVRLHGPDGAYKGTYDDTTLSGWAKAFLSWTAAGKEVYCYFDNDERAYAVRNALRLKELLEA
jgi:uncharacterized protein YecE (DUF72 family)